jgi:hypothetical protein
MPGKVKVFQPQLQKVDSHSYYSSYSSKHSSNENCCSNCSEDNKNCCSIVCGTAITVTCIALIVKFAC